MSTTQADIEASIDFHTFAHACTANELIDFDSAIQFFDLDREPSFLERLFTPSYLARACMGDPASEELMSTKSCKSMREHRDELRRISSLFSQLEELGEVGQNVDAAQGGPEIPPNQERRTEISLPNLLPPRTPANEEARDKELTSSQCSSGTTY
eukprot:gnl/TRDRNA2_/TRDRNA2_171749_c2_seq5.p1 gnl/TRDRNA2_/TRDRNA2_171749_c2~~gnl/TRDRNA2_/TRDRNA2_171749_c2_seq5.p1  ORF type:complete len:180 (+),score=20.23 gnl/TRDRNA2_/TRDRNA2_171749_c2_seq5:76-540(+)